MTSETRQAPPGFRRPQLPVREGGATLRSGQQEAEAQRTGHWDVAPQPAPDLPPAPPAAPIPRALGPRAAARRARKERKGMAGVVCYLAVLVCVAAGMYIAWRDGSHGGGGGGAVAGVALLLAAAVRLLLPARLAGLLASRHRVTDVLTLTVFGAGLLVAGLVLPRLGPPLSAKRGEWPARR